VISFPMALGDAAGRCQQLAGDAAAGSFHSSMELWPGRDDFEVTAAGGLPWRSLPASPGCPTQCGVSPPHRDHRMFVATCQTVPLIGVDVVAEEHSGTIIGDALEAKV